LGIGLVMLVSGRGILNGSSGRWWVYVWPIDVVNV